MDDKNYKLTPPPAANGEWLRRAVMPDNGLAATAYPNAANPDYSMPMAEMKRPMENILIARDCDPYVMVKITKQDWDELYEPDLGFERGTIFPALDLPFVGEGACRYE